MKIVVTSVLVDDQAKALAFYEGKLGFAKKEDVPLGAHRWLTVVSPEAPDGVERLLPRLGQHRSQVRPALVVLHRRDDAERFVVRGEERRRRVVKAVHERTRVPRHLELSAALADHDLVLATLSGFSSSLIHVLPHQSIQVRAKGSGSPPMRSL